MKSQKTKAYVTMFTKLYNALKDKGLEAQLVQLDNEVLKALIKHFTKNNLDVQLVTAGMHGNNPAKCAIQTFKSYFKLACSCVHPQFPKWCWGLLTPQVVTVINLLQPLRINATISAYNQVNGIFDFNQTLMAPPGTKLTIFDNTAGSWDPKGESGFTLDPVWTIIVITNVTLLVQKLFDRMISLTGICIMKSSQWSKPTTKNYRWYLPISSNTYGVQTLYYCSTWKALLSTRQYN